MSGAAKRTQSIRLLIVDDHPIVRDGLRAVFEASGLRGGGRGRGRREAVDRAVAAAWTWC